MTPAPCIDREKPVKCSLSSEHPHCEFEGEAASRCEGEEGDLNNASTSGWGRVGGSAGLKQQRVLATQTHLFDAVFALLMDFRATESSSDSRLPPRSKNQLA